MGAVDPSGVQLSMSLSVSGDYAASTKMTGNITQTGSAKFRGIQRMEIIPFKLSSGNKVSSEDTRFGNNIGLLQIGLPSDTFGSDAQGGSFPGLVTGSNSHLYGLVYIQSGVNAALVYGKAIDEAVTIDSTDSLSFKKRNGILHAPDLQAVPSSSDITFRLESYLNKLNPDYNKIKLYDTWRRDLTWYLNQTAQASVKNKLTDVTYRFNYMDQKDYPEDLRAAFNDFVAYGKVTPASKEVLDSRLTNIYKKVFYYAEAKKNSAAFHDGTYYYVYELANVIKKNINDSKYVTIAGSGQWMKVSLVNDGPSMFGLPYGAYALQYREGARRFDPFLENKDDGTGRRVGIFTANEEHFTYPPSLYYMSNGPVKTTRDKDVSTYYRTETGTWEDILSLYDESSVTVKSKSAAICEPLQYAVARMDLNIEACATNILDSKGNNVGMNNYNFPLTGILVTGQKNADYSFSPLSTSTEYIVYDSDISGAYVSHKGASSVPVLLMETEEGAGVNFALEFRNNSKYSFYGINDCEIAPGMHFYLIGKMDARSEVVDGMELKSIFVKDRVTTVNASITSFENAHTVLPDLRQTQLSIGVDAVLNWYQTDPVTIEIK